MRGSFPNLFPVKEVLGSYLILVSSYVTMHDENDNFFFPEKIEEKYYPVSTTISNLRKYFYNGAIKAYDRHTYRSTFLYAITTRCLNPLDSIEEIEIQDRYRDGSEVTLNDFMFVGKSEMYLNFHIESKVSFGPLIRSRRYIVDTIIVCHVLRYYQQPPYSVRNVSLGNKRKRVRREAILEEYPRNANIFMVSKYIYQKYCVSEGLYLREVFTRKRGPFNPKVVIHDHNVEGRDTTIADVLQLTGYNELRLNFEIDPKFMHPIDIARAIPSKTFMCFHVLLVFVVTCLVIVCVLLFYFFSD